MTKEKPNEMSYEKCHNCPHAKIIIYLGDTNEIFCNVTGDSIRYKKIKECPRGEA